MAKSTDFRLVARLFIAPLMMGFAGAAAVFVLADTASAKGFFAGALLVAVAMLVSGGFYARVQSLQAGRVLIRLALTSALKWLIVMGGTAAVLAQSAKGGLPPAAFTCGVIAGLVSTLFNTVRSSTGASTS